MNTLVTMHGFNLNCGAVKETLYKWLNLALPGNKLLPDFKVVKINCYTVKIGA